MDQDLEIGKSYCVEDLLGFLYNNYRQNIFLASKNGVDLLQLPRDKKFVIIKIDPLFLHKFDLSREDNHTIVYNQTNNYKLYYIEPE